MPKSKTKKKSTIKKLTNKQKLFIKHYAKLRNATRAAIEAGYSEDTAGNIGAQNVMKLQIEIDIEIQRQADRIDIEIQDIVSELSIIAFSDVENYISINEGGGIDIKSLNKLPLNITRAIETIQEDRIIKENADGSQVTVHDKIKFKLHSKIKALELLGKYKAIFIEKHEHKIQILNMEEIIKNMNESENDKK